MLFWPSQQAQNVAKLLHILIKLTHVHVLTIKHHMVQLRM